MKDTFYFTHDYYSRHDKAMVSLQMKKGVAAIGVFWCIVEMLYEEGGYLSLDEYERITFELRCEYDLIKYVIEESELFEIKDGYFYSNTILERLKVRQEKSKKATNSINKRWENQRLNTNVLQTKYDSNTIKERKGKERKEKEIKENNKKKKDILDFLLFDEQFIECLKTWLEYKKERKEPYKSQKGLNAFYNKLIDYSKNDPDTAKKIIEQSMANNWAGIFELKESQQKNKDPFYKEPIVDRTHGFSIQF